jgi:hypothetical protein
MRVTTKLTISMLTGDVLEHEFYEYVGPVEQAKKGSEAAKTAATGANNVASTATGLSASDQSIQSGARNSAQPFVNNLMATKPGGLSPYSQSQYQSSVQNNAKTAQNQRAAGDKASALRGFGGTPGTNASVLNTTNQQQGANDNAAYQGALQSTLGQGLAGVNYEQQQQGLYNPNGALAIAPSAYNAAANAAQVQNTSPTLMGDIGQGISGLAGAAGSVMTGMGAMGGSL